MCCVFLEWVSSTTRPERNCSVGLYSYYLLYAPIYLLLSARGHNIWTMRLLCRDSINYCMHRSCFWSQHLCRLVRTQVLSWCNPIQGAEQGYVIDLHTSTGLMPFHLPLLPCISPTQPKKKIFFDIKAVIQVIELALSTTEVKECFSTLVNP